MVDGALHEAQAQQADVEVDVRLDVAGDASDVMQPAGFHVPHLEAHGLRLTVQREMVVPPR